MMKIEANEKHKRCSIEMWKNKFNKKVSIIVHNMVQTKLNKK